MDQVAEGNVPARQRQPKMVFGFCMSGHHRLCHGSYRRPHTAKGEEQPDAVCSCRCHEDPDWIDPRMPELKKKKTTDEGRKPTFVYKRSKFP